MRCPFVGRGDKGRPLHWALGMLGVPVSYCLEFGLSGPEYGFPLAASFGDHPIIAHHHDRDSKRTSIYKYGMHLPLRLRSYYLGHHRPLDKAGPSPSFPRSVLQCTCYEVPTCILLYIHIHIYIYIPHSFNFNTKTSQDEVQRWNHGPPGHPGPGSSRHEQA